MKPPSSYSSTLKTTWKVSIAPSLSKSAVTSFSITPMVQGVTPGTSSARADSADIASSSARQAIANFLM